MVSISSVLPKENKLDKTDVDAWLASIAVERDDDEMDYLRAASMEALHLYKDETKPSGELTILYVLHVADILNKLKLDVDCVAALYLDG